MSVNYELINSLRQHNALCEELLAVVQREKKAWSDPNAPAPQELYQIKKRLLPRLEQSVDQLHAARAVWQKMSPEERAENSEIPGLLEQNQNIILKIIVLDRENEQVLLRRGLNAPTQRSAPVVRQPAQPHFVAELYRRNRF